MPVIVELDQPFGGGDAEQGRSPQHQKAYAQIAREQRYQEPVAEIGDELALVPPGAAGIAGPEERQHREGGAQRDRYRNDLDQGHAHAVDDRDEFLEHDATTQLTMREPTLAMRVSGATVK